MFISSLAHCHRIYRIVEDINALLLLVEYILKLSLSYNMFAHGYRDGMVWSFPKVEYVSPTISGKILLWRTADIVLLLTSDQFGGCRLSVLTGEACCQHMSHSMLVA